MRAPFSTSARAGLAGAVALAFALPAAPARAADHSYLCRFEFSCDGRGNCPPTKHVGLTLYETGNAVLEQDGRYLLARPKQSKPATLGAHVVRHQSERGYKDFILYPNGSAMMTDHVRATDATDSLLGVCEVR